MKKTDGSINTHLFDERVVVDLDVNVDGGVGKSVKHVLEERDALVVSPLTETLCTDQSEAGTQMCTSATQYLLHKEWVPHVCVRERRSPL